jgi:hypothetical protein
LHLITGLSADMKVNPMPDGDHSASNHPTALASQVAWITGESQISRPEPNLPARQH